MTATAENKGTPQRADATDAIEEPRMLDVPNPRRTPTPKRHVAYAIILPAVMVLAPGFHRWPYWWLCPLGEGVLLFLMFRLLGSFTARRLSVALVKGPRRNPARHVSSDELEAFQKRLATAAAKREFSAEQLGLFASSILHPAACRRRLTDHFTPGRRVLERQVLIEFDMDSALDPYPSPEEPATRAPAEQRLDSEREPKYVAIMLPRKGDLHDNARVTDADGRALPALSYQEYRLLMALTLRGLLSAAFNRRLTAEARRVESKYLQLLLQYGVAEATVTTPERVAEVKATLTELAQGLPDQRARCLTALSSLIDIIATHYAVVVALPADTPPRFFVSCTFTEIPSLKDQGLRAACRILLGARPISLQVSAANAATCQSYHLEISAPDEVYVGDFSAPFQETPADNQISPDSKVSYHRIRGRRGQNYFHLYSRVGQAPDLERLKLQVKFFEVPPGSIGRAAIAAIACLLTCLSVAAATANPTNDIDGNVAAFLLAIPGIAAVWMGFEVSQPRLLEGTLAARVSLIVTFAMSVASGVLLLFEKVNTVTAGAEGEVLVASQPPHILWLIIAAVAAVNAAVTCAFCWERTTYYRALITRPAENSSVMLAS
jgi:hypothetical protein